MTKKSNIKSFLGFGLSLIGLLAISGTTENVFGQQDPFAKPVVRANKSSVPKPPGATTTVVAKEVKPAKSVKVIPLPPMAEKVPSIEERIAYYKRLRETAAVNGQALPKPTMVMTLDELAVNGIFHNSKGFSAIVEATPIKLSYTIYPGERFFDGQLVAIEENRLVFRRITKMSNGKTIASGENKALRIYTVQEQFQGTAPVEQTAQNVPPPVVPVKDEKKPIAPSSLVSPLEQWEKQDKEPKTDPAKDAKNNTPKDAKSKKDKKGVNLAQVKKRLG